MKRVSFLLSILVVASLLLAACGSATSDTATEVSPLDETVFPGDTIPGDVTDDPLLTPDVTEEPSDMGDVTAEATVEATVEAVVPTVDATATVDATETVIEPGVDDDSAMNENYVLLSELLAMPVNDMNGTQVGAVDGVVIDRSAVITRSDTTDAETTDMASGDNPRISYLRVAMSDTTLGSVLVPFQAVAVEDSASSDMAAADSASSERALTLNVDSTILAGVPAFTGDVSAADWDADLSTYWGDQGLSIPMTGTETAAENGSVLLEGAIGDLSITGMDDAALGSVSDFVVDLTTGEILYALLSGGDTFGASFFPVPFSHLNWTADDSTMGSFNYGYDAGSFGSAPSFSSLDDFDGSNFNEVDDYWQGVVLP